jgi:hypothetical protein
MGVVIKQSRAYPFGDNHHMNHVYNGFFLHLM